MLTLRDFRKQVGFTQADLATKSGIRQATISALENGRSKAQAGTMQVPMLIKAWLSSLSQYCRNPLVNGARSSDETKNCEYLLDAYTDVHLGFVGIHPYADGNGRMARLLANIPVLRAGKPPILVSVGQRQKYITLLGDYSLRRGQPKSGEDLVAAGDERDALKTFFSEQWGDTLQLVEEFRGRQRFR